jgi:hypothetical protein
MRKLALAVLVIGIAAGAAFANGNTEKLTTIEGTIVAVEPAGTLAKVMVQTQAREEVAVMVPAGEIERLRIRVQTHIRVEGVYIGVPTQLRQQQQTRLLARIVNTGEGGVPVEEPVRLTSRDRQQIRTWEREQLEDGEGAQVQTQTQTQTQTQANKP